MPAEADDVGNSAEIEGGEEIMSAIDGLFEGADQQAGTSQATDTTKTGAAADQQQQTETPEQQAERARNEKGQFTKEQQEAKDKADKVAADAQAKGASAAEDLANPTGKVTNKNFEFVKQQRDTEKQRADAAETKFKQLETRLQEMEARSGAAAPEVKVLQEKITKLEAEKAETDRILSFKAVEETQAFREGVTQPQEEALEEINQAATTYKLEGRSIDEILREPNKFKRREMLEELTEALPPRSQFVKDDLRTNIEKYIAAEGKSKELFANAKGNRDFADQEKQQTEAKAALERQQAYQKANGEVDTILKDKFPEITGDPEKWKTITEKAGKIADFDRMPPKAKAFANVASFMLMPLMQMLRDERAEHEKTKQVMAKRNGSTPNPTGGRAAGGKKEGDEEGDIFAVLDQAFESA